MNTTKTFHLGDLLTITTGCLVSPRHMDGVYDICNWMTRDSLYTHQLPRAAQECAPELLRQHPDLADVAVPDSFNGKDHVESWLAEQVTKFGETRDVAPLPAGSHLRVDPIDELHALMAAKPDGKVVVVKVDGGPR